MIRDIILVINGVAVGYNLAIVLAFPDTALNLACVAINMACVISIISSRNTDRQIS